MFGRSKFGSGRGYSFNSSKHPFGRRHRNWIFLNRRKSRHHHHERNPVEEGSVIMTRDSPAIESISAVHDISDGERPRHLEISTTSGKSKDEDMTDAIELQTKEPTMNGHNGVNHKFKDHYHEEKDNDCCVKCVYFAQQCCECVIV
ncbi:uncharacterized protein LOC107047424 isoform X1 [Diachasma alloeum]|uniref:uncharacterized protein LOC107047424 isoform X1 n=1 Tax=Diachasma alloeum TaxID=454923 RepID=UPI00073848D5|nr:uncharacterized protein LOC107047424 isoform X1 [Diachasma alloeum]